MFWKCFVLKKCGTDFFSELFFSLGELKSHILEFCLRSARSILTEGVSSGFYILSFFLFISPDTFWIHLWFFFYMENSMRIEFQFCPRSAPQKNLSRTWGEPKTFKVSLSWPYFFKSSLCSRTSFSRTCWDSYTWLYAVSKHLARQQMATLQLRVSAGGRFFGTRRA